MELIDRRSGLQVIERAECLRLLATEEVGRLGVVVAGRPEIFPVNYVVDGDEVMFRTDAGTKLAGAM
jgi:nitroimidazol reductase NimA-like FMN-containing flavoprotein (pyridoxamine 5'-phosphate oxidase superfamily)